MGNNFLGRRNQPNNIGQGIMDVDKIHPGFEEMIKIPQDQFLCPKCERIPEILNVHCDNGHIELKCKYHGVQDSAIYDYGKILKDSMYTYFNTKCYNCNKIQGSDGKMFQYCIYCKVDLCDECVNKFDIKDKDHRRNHLDVCIPVNEKNHKCLEHNTEFTTYCADCQENVCDKETTLRHRGHNKINLFKFSNDINKYREIIVQKNKILSDIIRFNQIILNSYDNFQNNYFHIQSLINVGKSLEQENQRNSKELETMIYGLEKSHKAQQEALKSLNNEFQIDFDGNELKLSLRKRNLGDKGLKLISKIQFTSLKDMDVSGNNIKNIDALNDMILPYLEYLNVSENQIIDITSIAELNSKKLKEICLQKNNISNFTPLLYSDFPVLERLRIENNHFNADLQESKKLLKKYSKKIIYIAKTLNEFNEKYGVTIENEMQIIDLNDLRAGDDLFQELYLVINPDFKIFEITLRNNNLTNASLMSRIPFKHLRKFDLSVNEITNVNFLIEMKCKNLREIYLNDNKINDISCLIQIYDRELIKDSNFPNLQVISLKNNLLKDEDKESQKVLEILESNRIETDIKKVKKDNN